jgi:hypothetical protein
MSENQKGQNQSDEKKGGVSRLLIIIGAVIIVLLVAVIVILLLKKDDTADTGNNNTENRQVANSARLVLDEETASSVMEEMRKEVEEGMFECNMSMNWTFDNGEAESRDAYVANSVNNTHPIYFDLYLKDSGELLYSSPVIPVGAELTNFKLDKPLPAGVYDAKCAYSLLRDEENQEVISAANFIVTVTVLN